MQINVPDYLEMVEESKKICFFDIESTGLKGDYGSILVVSVKPYGEKPKSFVVNQIGNDVGIVMAAKEELEKYHCWVSFYGKGFDIPMLNTRLLKWKKKPIDPRHHIDLYFSLKHNLNTTRKSLAHLTRFLNVKSDQKIDVNPDVWAEIGLDPKNKQLMKVRCESDCTILENLYDTTKHLIKDIKRGGI